MDENVVRVAREAMRTRFEIVLADADRSVAVRRAAGEEALAAVAEVESWLSAYREGAALREVNGRAGRGAIPTDPRLLRLLAEAQALSVRTGGAFDMTVGPLRRLWEAASAAGRAPTDVEVAEVMSAVGMAKVLRLDRDAGTVTLTHPDARLDPGAIGKGYALDRAAEVLREAGIRTALLHGGTSSVVALGGPWKVAVANPAEPGGAPLRVIELTDRALGVSAPHGKVFAVEGQEFGHVLDPRTGRPVAHTLLAAVTGASGTETEALSTAALVLGSDGLPALARHFPVAGFLLAERETSGNVKTVVGGRWSVVS